jgi:succinate dehydrogenase / fumarate reductase cytochrome b subunit
MAETRQGDARPLSPHLSVYRPLINMVMSILHRLTGAALYLGTLLLAAWLIAAATGEREFNLLNAVFAHPLGKLVLVGYSWALLHHMLGGLRHLLWDTGRGFSIPAVNALSWATIIGSITLTAALWTLGLSLAGR